MAIKEKHLEIIQGVITRHNSNSFLIKGWTITIVSAIFAIAGTLKEPFLTLIPLIPILIFWYLDSFYLANERCFISLYNCAINGYTLKVKNKELLKDKQIAKDKTSSKPEFDPEQESELTIDQFSMNYTTFQAIERNNIRSSFRSVTIRRFYIALIIFSFLLFSCMLIFNIEKSSQPIKVITQIENESLNIKSQTPQTFINNIVLDDSIINLENINNQ